MPKKRLSARLCGLLAALLLSSLLPCPARSAQPGEDYLVRLRGGEAPFAVVCEAEMLRLRSLGLLEWYEPDGELLLTDAELTGTLSPFFDDACWNLDMIGAEAAFARELLGQGVRVGVLDSGVDPHPDFAERLLPGRNYAADAEDRDDTSDRLGHGTRVAGLIAASGEDGHLGVAPGAELVPLKVTDGVSVKVSVVCEAIYGGVDDFGCRVINLSMGVPTEYRALQEAVTYAEEHGVTVVSAVGNDGTDTLYWPANCTTVMGVGAVGRDGSVTDRSNRNGSVFLTAPGTGLKSTAGSGGYMSASGTSFAVPQVSGAAAVLLGADPALTPADVRALLAAGADDRGDGGFDTAYGYGVLDLGGALAVLAEGDWEPLLRTPAEEVPPIWERCSRDEGCPLRSYSDLDCGAWYHDGVHYALETGLMQGVDDGRFAPNGVCSRAMLVTILWRREGSPAAAGSADFADVPQDTWYAEAVRWAAAEGIVQGYDAEHFGPADPVSREQLAVLLRRYLTFRGEELPEEASGLETYGDAAEIAPWARDAMEWAVRSGLLSGTGAETLSPKSSAVRAQVATVLKRYSAMLR